MAKAKVGAGGIEYIQGALKKPVKKDGHNHGNYVIMTHREAPTTSPDCQRMFVKDNDAYKRKTPLTSDEQAARTRFGAIGTAVAARRKNLATIATDMANFNAQKDSGYKTFYSYLWHLCADQYDQNNG